MKKWKNMNKLWCVLCAMCLTGCSTVFAPKAESGYTYVPIDPFAVQTVPGDSCKETPTRAKTPQGTLLQALPDNAVRMLIERFNASGTVTYGPAKLGAKGESYRVTVDYINADTINFRIWLSKSMRRTTDGVYETVPLLSPQDSRYFYNSELYRVTRDTPTDSDLKQFQYSEFNIPVYVGIGLRVSANVEVVGASANISGIGVIGAEAEAERVKGSLVVQTLGINGKSISAALPIQSELNRTTAQNAIVSVGSIKALLYADDTTVVPRVVGLYLPFPGGKPLVNAIISELSKKRVEWPRPCQMSFK